MKHVKISKYHKSEKNYIVFLGNGTCHNFKQDREAKKFLATTSRFLTTSLYDLRFVFSQVSALFIRNWGYFKHNKVSMSSKLLVDEIFCKESLRNIEDSFDLIINRCEYTNGNYFAFQKQSLIVRQLKDVVLKLDKLHATKSNAADRFEFDAIFSRLKFIEEQLNDYNRQRAFEMFSMPIHIGDDRREFIPELKITA